MDIVDRLNLWRILDAIWLPILLCVSYHTGAYFPTWRLLVSFWFRSILVRESTVRDIIFQFGVQSRYFPSQHSE